MVRQWAAPETRHDNNTAAGQLEPSPRQTALARYAFPGPTQPLDSRFRGNDDSGGSLPHEFLAQPV